MVPPTRPHTVQMIRAAKVAAIDQSSWTSGNLITDQTYYFAVRAQDSASTPNEDENTAEIAVAVTGGQPVEDHDPPVWTETYKEDDGYGTQWEHVGEGMHEVRVGDGKLIITCADAVDELGDGKVRMSFASRPGVCGDGYHSISMDGGRGWHMRRGPRQRRRAGPPATSECRGIGSPSSRTGMSAGPSSP